MSTPDRIFLAFGARKPLGTQVLDSLVPQGVWEDTLKFSACEDGDVMVHGSVLGGLEDCVDVNNHCRRLTVHADLWMPQGQYLATIKGGSQNITLSGTVRGHGKTTDVDLGNISDQSDDLTGPVYLNLVHEAGDPIYVRRLNASDPVLLNGATQRYVISRPLWGVTRGLWARGYAVLKKLGLPI